MQKSVTLVIPCFNSAKMIPTLARQCLEAGKNWENFELVLVDDGSSDSTWKEILAVTGTQGQVRGCRLLRNYGEHAALLSGMKIAKGDYVITLDDDLQHNPQDFSRLTQALDEGADLVYGQYDEYCHSSYRKWGSRWNGWMATLMHGRPFGLHLSSYRGIQRSLVEKILQEEVSYLDAALLKHAEQIEKVPVSHRTSPLSRYSLPRLLQLHAKGLGLGRPREIWVRELVNLR